LDGVSPHRSWCQCATKKSWKLPMNLPERTGISPVPVTDLKQWKPVQLLCHSCSGGYPSDQGLRPRPLKLAFGVGIRFELLGNDPRADVDFIPFQRVTRRRA